MYEAVWRWWEKNNHDDEEAYQARNAIRKMADKGRAFMQTMTEAMSRNLYMALLNDAYSQVWTVRILIDRWTSERRPTISGAQD